ncbi:MAG: 3-hydroxyacyl-CoA dehydrogenase family protein [Anaerolineae bacterium]|nr:3-hydroxyacyl-CoA dehydrogenase family protein [Anaerolineae bacterium]
MQSLARQTVAVIGAGTMGADIAQSVALGGYDVILHDINDTILRRALARISRGLDKGVALGKNNPLVARRAKRAFVLTTDLDRCGAADVVIEAVREDMGLKQSVFQALDGVVAPNTILATSSNTLSVTALAAETRYPERVIGLHFCRPAHIMRLVEVVRGDATRQDVLDQAVDLVSSINKTPVVLQDLPGLIVNRMAHMYFSEALRLADDARLDAATIDRLMEAAGFPMGPFRLMDYLGAGAVFEAAQALYEATFHESRYRPHPRQRRMAAGRLARGRDGGWYPAGE